MHITLAALILLTTIGAQTPIAYRIALDPQTLSTFTVSVVVPRDVSGDLRLLLPTWSPRSWRASSWGERVQTAKARDGSGNPIGVTRDGDVLLINGRAPVTVTIQVGQTIQALGVREYFTTQGALLDGTRSLPLVGGAADRPCTIQIDAPEGWEIACPLPQAGSPQRFKATDYAALVDAPIMLGDLSRWKFDLKGVPHELVLDRQGKEGQPTAERLLRSLEGVAKAHESMVGEAPYKQWTLLMVEGVGGERHHRNALTVGVDEGAIGGDTPELILAASISMASTRVAGGARPAALVQADPLKSPKTSILWFTRGWPRWAGRLALLRAEGRPTSWCDDLCDAILRHRNHSLVDRLSPAEASRTIAAPWRGLDPSLAGYVLSAALDMTIRDATKAKKSLSDVVRDLIQRTDPAVGFTADDLAAAAAAIGGTEAKQFFARHTESTDPIPWDRLFQRAGLHLEWIQWRVADPTLRCTTNDGKVLISGLRRRSTLYAAGARIGDAILAVNQRRPKAPLDVDRQIGRMRPGQKLRIDVRRAAKQRSFRVTMSAAHRLRIPLDDDMRVRNLPPGPARDAGLANGDTLLKIDNTRISRERDVRVSASRIKGSKAALTIIRNGRRRQITVKVPAGVTWRGALTLDPKATPEARGVREAILNGPE